MNIFFTLLIVKNDILKILNIGEYILLNLRFLKFDNRLSADRRHAVYQSLGAL